MFLLYWQKQLIRLDFRLAFLKRIFSFSSQGLKVFS